MVFGKEEIEKACMFMEQHFAERIYLDQICRQVRLSKSTLLRSFTKSKRITPYCYLETIRINEAKKLLSNGVSPFDAAIRTDFSDQSHFTNYFTSFIGLTPGVYHEIFFEKDKGGEFNFLICHQNNHICGQLSKNKYLPISENLLQKQPVIWFSNAPRPKR